jgi:hypothetical protein
MDLKDTALCSSFWKQLRDLAELAHTRGAEGLVDALLEEFAHVPAAQREQLHRQLTQFVGLLPLLKQTAAAQAGLAAPVRKVPYG